MADLIKKIKIKKQDGTFTDYIPIGADAVNVETSDGESVELKLNKKPYYYDTVADMKADTKLKAGDVVQTLGYYEENDGGSGLYKIVDDSQLVDDGGSIHNLINGLKAVLVIENGAINVKQFGAKGNGIYDDTNAMQNIIDYSCSNNYKKIFIPNGSYIISSKISTPQAFNQPIISGENTKNTILNFSGESCLRFKGGSGNLANSYLENITFTGNNENIAIELEGVCGYTIDNCLFINCSTGVLFHNNTSGEFTEYCIVRDSRFTGTCKTAIEYKRTNGNDSFHGSGIESCIINQNVEETEYKIKIGNGCLVYNAPLDFTCWKNNIDLPLIDNNSGGNIKNSFYGDIRLETKQGQNQKIISDTKPIYLCGDVLLLSGYITYNNLILCNKIHINPDTSLTIQRKPYSFYKLLQDETTDLIQISDAETCLVDIQLHASNYEVHYVLLVGGLIAQSKTVFQNLFKIEGFNVAGYGEPTFGYNGRYLTITNSNYSEHDIECYVNVTQLRSRKQFQFI